MGIIGYYCRFIEGFSKITYQVTSLWNEWTKFVFSNKCEESFEKLKKFLTIVPILRILDTYKGILACMNSYIEGLGSTLLEEDYVISYEWRKFKEYERNYATHDWELSFIIHALRMWRQYLIGRKITLMYIITKT